MIHKHHSAPAAGDQSYTRDTIPESGDKRVFVWGLSAEAETPSLLHATINT